MEATELKVNYDKIFKMFCCEGNNHQTSFKQVFTQNGKYYATDGISAIRMPMGGEMLDVWHQEQPPIDSLIPTQFHEPIAINVSKLEAAILKLAPLVDEFEEEAHECRTCNGFGSNECDLGHDHDCKFCDGHGYIEAKNPTGNKICDPSTTFLFLHSGVKFSQLMRLVRASKLLGAESIYKIAGAKNEPYYFEVANTNVLIMHCHIGDTFPEDAIEWIIVN